MKRRRALLTLFKPRPAAEQKAGEQKIGDRRYGRIANGRERHDIERGQRQQPFKPPSAYMLRILRRAS